MGGGIALDNAVDRLALIDSYGLGEDAPWRPMASVALRTPGVDRLLWQSMGVNHDTVRGTPRGYTAQAPEAFVAEIHDALQDPDSGRALRSWQRSEFSFCGFRTCYFDALSELSVPTLLVHGEQDTLLPPTWSERAHERLPESELQLRADCGHWPPRERAGAFNRTMAEFLASERPEKSVTRASRRSGRRPRRR